MSFRPLVSVIVPVYNGARYLAEALDSVLAQTYSNFEVIVVNDGSTDQGATAEVARKYGDSVRYFEKPNEGVATALNKGLEEMRGEYFSWLSHDDTYLPNKLQHQIDFLAKLKDKDVVLYSDYQLIDEDSSILATRRLDHQMLTRKPLYSILRSAIHGCSLMVPRKAFDRVGLFDARLETTQDYALWFKMIRHFPFRHLPEVLIQGRLHAEQTTNTHPDLVRENDELWIDFATSTSRQEMLECENSVYLFYAGLEKHLAVTPYARAHEHVKGLRKAEEASIRERLPGLRVGVLALVAETADLNKQTHSNLEIVPLEAEGGSGESRRLELFKRAAVGTEAEFIAFWDGSRWPADRLASQLETLQRTGNRVSLAGLSEEEALYPRLLATGAVKTGDVLVERAALLRVIEEVTEELHLWYRLAREDIRPGGGATDGELQILNYLLGQDFCPDFPLELADFFRRVAGKLEHRVSARILQSMAYEEDPLWEKADICNRWARRTGRFYWRLPEQLRERFSRPVDMVLVRLLKLAEKEKRIREWALLNWPRRRP